MNKIVIGITGHRLLDTNQKVRIKPVIKKALENIMFIERERDSATSFVALTPLAEGADSLFAQVAVELGIQLHIILPYEKELYKKGFSNDELRHEFDLIYDAVDDNHKRELSQLNGREANQLFLELGMEMVHSTDYLLAIWNEKEAKGKGGTADTVLYGMSKKKNLLLINPEEEYPSINYLHHDHKEIYKADGVIYPPETNHLAAFIVKKQADFDNKAVHYNKRYRKLWTIVFVAGLVEVFAFALNTTFHPPIEYDFPLSTIEFLSLALIILMIFFGNSKDLHYNYVHYRIISERLRIKRFFCELGCHIYDTVVSPIYFSLKENPEFVILDNTIKLINLSAWSNWTLERKKEYLEAELILNQKHYHDRKKLKFRKRNELYKKVRGFMFLAVAGSISLHYLKVANHYLLHQHVHLSSFWPSFFESPAFEPVTLFISLFLPPAIAACEALKYLYEWEKIITLSEAMHEYFGKKSALLKKIKTDKELEDFLNDINRDMLVENLDWEKYMHDKNEVPA